MKNDINITDIALNRMSHEVNLEFPELEIIWIPHTTSERKNILDKKIHKIDSYAGGRNIIPSLTLLAQDANETERIAAINIEKSKNILFGEKATAGFFLNVDNIEDDFSFKHMVYIDIYILLSLLGAPKINLKNLRKTHDKVIEPLISSRQKILTYTGADCFAAICLSMQGHKNAFSKIAKIRARQSMETTKGIAPEIFAFPLILELAQLIYKNYSDKIHKNNKSKNELKFAPLFTLTKTIEAALDPNTAKSWETFAKNTQTLAWQGIAPRKILGAAAYTCEDPFISSNAYLTSEILNIEPALTTHPDFYNPFAEDEINEKNHKKLCLDYFEVIIETARKEQSYDILKTAATEQNKRFLSGNIMGWSAPALIKLSNYYAENNDTQQTRQSAENLFAEDLKEMPWPLIKEAGKIIIKEKQKLNPLSSQEILENFNKNEDLKKLAEYLAYAHSEEEEETTTTT